MPFIKKVNYPICWGHLLRHRHSFYIQLDKIVMTSRVMVLGVGAFAHAVQSILQEDGAETACYLTRP